MLSNHYQQKQITINKMNNIMKLEEEIEIVLDVARHPLTNNHSDDDALEATNVVEDFFVNNVFEDED